MRAWLAAWAAITMRRRFALVTKPLPKAARDLWRAIGIVLVVAFALSSQQRVPGVVIVVVPLRSIVATRRIFRRIEQAHSIVVVLENKVNVPPALPRMLPHRLAEIIEDTRLTGSDDRVHGVQPQTVEAIIAHPHERVFDRKSAHLRHRIID